MQNLMLWQLATAVTVALAAAIMHSASASVVASSFTPPQPPCPGPDWWDDNGVCNQGCASNSQKRHPETMRCLCAEAPPNSGCMSWGKCCAGQCVDGAVPAGTAELHSGACEEGGAPGISDWGASFLVVFATGSALYTVGGVALGRRAQQAGLAQVRPGGDDGLKAHPHYQRWVGVVSLVTDGVAFTRGGRRRPPRQPLEEPAGAPPRKKLQRADKSSRAPKSQGKSSGSSKAESSEQSLLGGGDETRGPAATAEASGARSHTPSGGGGQWVHVPDG